MGVVLAGWSFVLFGVEWFGSRCVKGAGCSAMVWVRDEVTRFMACLAGWLEGYGSGLGGCVRPWSLVLS
jgi:hypothetical protein